MKERPALLVTRYLSTPSRRAATSLETCPAPGPSKLIAALDALVLNDAHSINKESKDDDDDDNNEDVEIVATGPIPIKPKKTSRRGTRKANSAAKNEPEHAIHSFFLRASSKPTPGTLASGSKVRTRATENTMQSSTQQAKSLPLYSYKDYTPKSTIVYTRHEEEADDLILALKNGPVGFDLEWRVLWARRANAANATPHNRRIAVVQIADTAGLILVVQVYGMSRFPKKLQELIENPDIPKLGANILNDGMKLFEDYGIVAKNLLELGALVQLADPAGGNALTGMRQKYKNIISLAKLVEHYCEKSLDKNKALRMCNWEAVLDESQINYAANDAHCAVKVHDRLQVIGNENGIQLDNDIIKKRCSSDVSTPSTKTLTKSEWHEIMPNMPNIAGAGQGNMRPQQLRAYKFWHEREMNLETMCIELSLKSKGYGTGSVQATGDENALKPSTVISYVISALQADEKLPFNMEKLRELVQMDAGSWERHRDWLLHAWSNGRGVAC